MFIKKLVEFMYQSRGASLLLKADGTPIKAQCPRCGALAFKFEGPTQDILGCELCKKVSAAAKSCRYCKTKAGEEPHPCRECRKKGITMGDAGVERIKAHFEWVGP